MPVPNSPVEGGALRRAWRGLRAWLEWLNGDAAYRSFVHHQRQHHPELPVPSRAAFYRMETDRRWNGVRRCC